MMRYITVALAVFLVLGTAATAKQERPIRSISVSGTVVTKTAPDRIVWRISLTDTDKDMRRAKEKNDAKIISVLSLREKLGVGDEDIETGSVSIRREYERSERGVRGEFKHFVVMRSVTIRQRDMKRFDEFLDALVSSAEMEVHFNYESSRIHEIRAETRLRALQAARQKAEDMAGAVGAKLGKIVTITEAGQSALLALSNQMVSQSMPSVDFASEKFVPGAMTVQVTVNATFELE